MKISERRGGGGAAVCRGGVGSGKVRRSLENATEKTNEQTRIRLSEERRSSGRRRGKSKREGGRERSKKVFQVLQ